MPELPEVETVRRGLAAAMEGRRILAVDVNRPDLRVPFPANFAERLAGRTVSRLDRRAKYLLMRCDGDVVMIGHLGMSGRMIVDDGTKSNGIVGSFVHDPGPPEKHEHVVFHMEGGISVRYSDPRRFGMMTLADAPALDAHPWLSQLGPEPTGNDFTGAALVERLAGKQTPIKAALLDQRVVAGLGNIYVCESLFMAGISPKRKAASVLGARAERLANAIRAVLADAIAAGGSTLRDHVAPNGELGYFQHSFRVYDREGQPCPGCDCGGTVRRLVQSGRSTFYCATRQR